MQPPESSPDRGAAGPQPIGAGAAASDPASRGFGEFQQSGNREALAESLLACAPELMLKLRQWRVSLQDQPDLVQECFAIAIRRSADFDTQRRLQPWLLGILENLVRAHRRHLSSKAQLHPLAADEPVGSERDPVEWLDLTTWRQRVQTVLSTLPTHYRSVLHEHLMVGRSTTDIAVHLQRSPSTVRTQLERGLRELRRRLPAPLLVGLLAVQSAAQAPPDGSALPEPVRTGAPRWFRWSLAPAAVLIVGVAAILTFWPPTTANESLANTASGDPATEVTAPGSTERVTRTPAEQPAVASDRGEVHIQLLLASGAPAAGVAVTFEAPTRPGQALVRSQFRWRSATTDADGLVVFRGVPPGSAALRLHDLGSEREFRVQPGTQHSTVTVEPLDRIQVTVVDAADTPVRGAEVWISGMRGKKSPGYVAARTDERGVANVAVFLRRFSVWARVPGSATTRMSDPLEAGAGHRLTLKAKEREASFLVRVEDSFSRPVSGAMLAAWSERSRDHPPTFGLSDESGRAVLEGLLPGPVRIVAVTDEGDLAETVVETRAEGTPPPQTVPLRVRRGGTIRGRIVGLAGERAARTRVVSKLAGDAAALHPFDGDSTVPSDDGTFVLEGLAGGDHHVGVFALGEASPKSVHRVRVVESAVSDLQIVTDDSRPKWKVRVVDDTGQPLSDCWLRTVSPLLWVGPRHDLEWRADAEGVAHVLRLGDAPQVVAVHLSRRSPSESTGATPVMQRLPVLETAPMVLADTTIVVPRSKLQVGRVRGRIPPSYRDPRRLERLALVTSVSGKPIVLAEDGIFAVDGVPPGEYRLRLASGDGADRCQQYLARFALAPGQDLDLGPLPDPGAGVLVVSLPAAAATVPLPYEIRDVAGELVAFQVAKPGGSDEYRLAAGAYTVHFASATAVWRQRRCSVQPGGRTRVEIERHAGRHCRIRVVASAYSPSPSPLLGRIRRIGSGEDCRVALAPELSRMAWVCDLDLSPGRYEIEVESAWGPRTSGILDVRVGEGRSDYPLRLR